MMKTSAHPLLLETETLQEKLDDPNLRILDCSVVMKTFDDGSFAFVSGQEEWQQSHIPGSVFVDVQIQLSDPDHDIELMMLPPERFLDIMRELGIGDDNHVVVYDRGNHAWATRVWWMLRVCGVDNVSVLNGGWNKWLTEDLAVTSEQTHYPPAAGLTLNYRPALMATKQTVLAALEDDQVALVHSLPAAVFTGKVRPYVRAGRIPNSKNLYCENLLDPDTKCYLQVNAIRESFVNTGALSAESIITYCGGGVAASSNAFALTLLGHDNVAVYDGSLTEWTQDENLPMEID